MKLRAHHLSCIPRFYHGGYNRKFAENMKKLCMRIRKNSNTKIKVVLAKPDDICFKCPYLYKGRCVQSPEIGKWVVKQDKKILKYLKLKENSIYSAKEIFNLSIKRINSKTIKSVCKNCLFLKNCIKVGLNKSFMEKLR
jgi:hypothetical protein